MITRILTLLALICLPTVAFAGDPRPGAPLLFLFEPGPSSDGGPVDWAAAVWDPAGHVKVTGPNMLHTPGGPPTPILFEEGANGPYEIIFMSEGPGESSMGTCTVYDYRYDYIKVLTPFHEARPGKSMTFNYYRKKPNVGDE